MNENGKPGMPFSSPKHPLRVAARAKWPWRFLVPGNLHFNTHLGSSIAGLCSSTLGVPVDLQDKLSYSGDHRWGPLLQMEPPAHKSPDSHPWEHPGTGSTVPTLLLGAADRALPCTCCPQPRMLLLLCHPGPNYDVISFVISLTPHIQRPSDSGLQSQRWTAVMYVC